MAVTFSSVLSPSILMLDADAGRLLEMLKKTTETGEIPPWGVITQAEAAEALYVLQHAAWQEAMSAPSSVPEPMMDAVSENAINAEDGVNFATHLVPFLKMLETLLHTNDSQAHILWKR